MTYEIIFTLAALLFAVFAWTHPRRGLLLIGAALPVYLIRLAAFGVPTTLLEVWVLTLAAITVLQTDIRNLSFPKRWIGPVVLLVTAAGIGTLVAPDTMEALGIVKAYFVEPILVFWMAVHYLSDRTDRRQLVTCMVVGGTAVAGFAVFQWISGLGIPIPWDIERRVTGVFPYPNALGLYLGPLAVFAGFGTYRYWKNRDPRAFGWGASFLVMFVAIVLAKSEAAILSTAVVLSAAALWSKRLRRYAIAVAAIVLVVFVLSPELRQPVVEKITLQDYSGQVRLKQWDDTWRFLQDNPLVGAGLSGYPTALAPYHTYPEIEIFQYPHTVLFNIWTELGMLGILAVIWIAVVLLREFLPLVRARTNHWTETAALVALVQMIVHGLVDVPYFKNDLAVLTWLLIALVHVAHKHASYEPSDQKHG